MNREGVVLVSPEDMSTELLHECCLLFDSSFEKTIGGRPIRMYPNRIRRYLAASQLVCAFKNGTLVGFLIFERIEDCLAWIKLIVVDKKYRNQRFGSRLVETLNGFDYVGLITNNPIMVKIVKKLGFCICQSLCLYEYVFAKEAIQSIFRLYCVDKMLQRGNCFSVLTHLNNVQEITESIDYSPLEFVEPGYEWFIVTKKL